MVQFGKQQKIIENHKSANVKRKLNSMDQLMDIEKVNEFNLLKKRHRKMRQKKLDIENRRLEDLIETLKGPNYVCEWVIALFLLLNVSKEIKLSQWF